MLRFGLRYLAGLRANPYGVLAVLLAVPAMLPLLAPGYFFEAHDARHSVFFLVMFDRVFSEGTLWPVWSPDQAAGFGYPLWLLYAPLAYFLGEAFHLLGFPFTVAVKLVWVTGFVLGAVGMFRLARRWWSAPVALVTSLAFTYAPYHLSQIYVRAALAEFMALNWFPWVVIAFVSLWERPGLRRAVALAVAVAVLLLTHTHSLLMFVPLLAGLVLSLWLRAVFGKGAERPWRERAGFLPLLWIGASSVLGLVLSSIFLLPMLAERQYVVQEQWTYGTYNYNLHFVYPSQFFDPDWGYLYSTPGANDGMSFQLGLVIVVLAAVGAFAVLRGARIGDAPRLLMFFILLGTLIALFVMTPASAFLWDILPIVALIQFPWRLLAVTVFCLAVLAGAGSAFLQEHGRVGSTPLPAYPLLTGLVLIAASVPFTHPPLSPVRPVDESPLAPILFELEHTDMRGMMRWSERPPTDADSPLFAQYLAGQPLQRAAVVAGEGRVLDQASGATSVRARIQADGPLRLRFYTYYFPGWYVTVNGQRTEIAPDPPNGLIGLNLPPGEHEVVLRFGPTPPRIAGAFLSALGWFAVVVVFVFSFLRRSRAGDRI
jgi:hypothetical protein